MLLSFNINGLGVLYTDTSYKLLEHPKSLHQARYRGYSIVSDGTMGDAAKGILVMFSLFSCIQRFAFSVFVIDPDSEATQATLH